MTAAPSAWDDALTALALFAVDPVASVGIRLRAKAGPVRARWLELLADALPKGAGLRKVPATVGADRLLGGLDLAATLSAGRPVAERGLMAEADGGVLLLAMAERLPNGTAALISSALDTAQVVTERDGLTLTSPTRFGIVLLDEGADADETSPRALTERIAFDIDLDSITLNEAREAPIDTRDIAVARGLVRDVSAASDVITALCETAAALAVGSIRAELLALAVARASAALNGHTEVTEEDAAIAARLVFAQRATQRPAAEETTSEAEPPPPEAPSPDRPDPSDDDSAGEDETEGRDLGEILREAVSVSLPADLLARASLARSPSNSRVDGRAGPSVSGGRRGQVIGTRAGRPGSGDRLNLLATLRAAAPWQKLRTTAHDMPGRVRITAADLRLSRFKSKKRTAIVFAVDASGSQALHRLAEAKGAVELLLAECYVRRDEVAVIAFRGRTADLILPPTHSLTRAKRALSGLPGGGATPLAAGMDAALALALQVKRAGQNPLVVLLTDGQSNVGRDGIGGRKEGEADALAGARAIRAAGLSSILIDTAQRPAKRARDVADAMGATYIPLPQANATALSDVVREAVR